MGPQPHTYGRGRFFRGRARGPFFAAGRYNGPGGPLLQIFWLPVPKNIKLAGNPLFWGLSNSGGKPRGRLNKGICYWRFCYGHETRQCCRHEVEPRLY
eukprot:gene19897-biopygen1000